MTQQTKSNRIIFISAIGFVLLLSAFSYLRVNTLIQSSDLVNRTTEVTLELETMIGNLKDAETGQRGYLLSHDARFLESLDNGLKEYAMHLTNAKKLIEDDPVQQQNLGEVETIAKHRDDYLYQMIELDKTRLPTASEMLVGKSIMDSLRLKVDKMIEVENNLLMLRTQELKRQTFLAPAVLFLLSIAALAILITSFWQLDRSLTKRGQTEQELKQKNISLEKMNEELSSFAYISSHDLQEPLRKIQLFVSRIEEKEINVLSDAGKEDFSRIKKSAHRMQQLIIDLLSYSRANNAEQHFENTDFNNLLEHVRQELSEKIVSSNATIEAERLPTLNVIPFQFKQLFTNIISNSIKFAKPGLSPHIRIKSSLVDNKDINQPVSKAHGQYHYISISDNGIGFDQQFNQQIFGLFQRLHSSSEFEGTGIGLSIVKKIVENHNGIITATGENNTGATFNIFIPALEKIS